jgi:hypothetical protein
MLMQNVFGRGEILAIWHEFHGPLIALAIALVLMLVARMMRSELIAVAAGGLAAIAGWYVTTGAALTLSPRGLPDRLPLLALGLLLVALAGDRLAAGRGPWPPLLIAALGSGWWLSGAPHTQAALLAAWPEAAVVALGVVLVTWLANSAGPGTDRLQPALAALTLAAALHVTDAPRLWVLLALTPAAASVPLLLRPQLSPAALLPVAADTGAVAAAALLTIGRLSRGAITAIDAASLSPLLALWLAPRIATRMRSTGRFSAVAGAVIAGAIAVGIAWGFMKLRGR